MTMNLHEAKEYEKSARKQADILDDALAIYHFV